MRVRCSRFRRWSRFAIDGELSAKEREAFERHRLVCGDCRVEFERLLRAVNLLARLPSVESGASFTANVMARVNRARQAQGEEARRKASWVTVTMVVAASACVVVGWSEWMLPAIVSTMSDGLVMLVKGSRVLGPSLTLIGALSALLRAFFETALTLGRSGASYALYVYVLTLTIILIAASLTRNARRRYGASMLCV
ncbi:MAG: hypothetical protein JXO72_06105 [Vicinamibacteria bacterium]|nr:hypothetical protein [Vicinamibacteria bacterium]